MQRAHVLRHALAFERQKSIDRISKRWMRQPMRAAGLHRQQGARHFVFALRAAFKALHAVLNAPLQRLVVAGLKVQAIDPLQRAPIAAIGGYWR